MADVELAVEVLRHTDGALLVVNLKDEEVWIGRFMISDYCGDDPDRPETIFVSQRVAEEKGLV